MEEKLGEWLMNTNDQGFDEFSRDTGWKKNELQKGRPKKTEKMSTASLEALGFFGVYVKGE